MIIIYIAVFYCFFIYFFKDSNFYKLILIFGKKGCGKTTLILKESIKYIKKGIRVYCNVEGIPGTYYYDPLNIGEYTFLPESVVFIDEIGTYWDNRDYKDFNKLLTKWLKLQRHYKIRIVGFDQNFTMDKKLRDHADLLYLCVRLGKISILRPIYKSIGISKDTNGNGQLVDTFRYGSIFQYKFTFLPRYYGMFDSFEAPALPEIESFYQDYNEYQELAIDTKKWIFFHLRSFFLKNYNRIYNWVSKYKR